LEEKMTYSISYDDGWPSATQDSREEGLTRIETFRTENEALKRASRLLDDGTHHAISVCDSSGNVLCGVRLQLKLGFSTE
jgi:CBS-domain-containing membrane protein